MALQFGQCRFDPTDGTLISQDSGESTTLRPQVARLLQAFLERPGQVIDRQTLCAAVWDQGTVVDFESGLAALIRELRQALDAIGAEPDWVETVPRRGYRFRHQATTAGQHHHDRRAGFRLPLWLIGAIGLLLLGAGLLAWWMRPPVPVPVESEPALAIMPFEIFSADDLTDSRLQLLLADTVLARMWQADLPGLVLIGRATLRPYHERDDLARAVAADLNVDLLLEGTIVALGEGGWRVDARLLAMPRGTVVWSESVHWEDRAELPVGPTAEYLVDALVEAWPLTVSE